MKTRLNLPLCLQYEIEDVEVEVHNKQYFTGNIIDADCRTICRCDTEVDALNLVAGIDEMIATMAALRVENNNLRASLLNVYSEEQATDRVNKAIKGQQEQYKTLNSVFNAVGSVALQMVNALELECKAITNSNDTTIKLESKLVHEKRIELKRLLTDLGFK